jgi:hypothetical protein
VSSSSRNQRFLNAIVLTIVPTSGGVFAIDVATHARRADLQPFKVSFGLSFGRAVSQQEWLAIAGIIFLMARIQPRQKDSIPGFGRPGDLV